MSSLVAKNQEMSVLERIRKEHVPSLGDIYFSESGNYYVKLIASPRQECWNCVQYDFVLKTWIKHYDLSNSNLKSYYKLVVQDWEELVQNAEMLLQGTATLEQLCNIDESQLNDSTDIALYAGKEVVLSEFEKTEKMYDKALYLSKTLKAIQESKQREIRRVMDSMQGVISALHDKVNNAMKVLSVLEIYSGCEETILQVVEGAPASIESPVCIRQRILYMDEEMMVNAWEGGLDYTDKHRFYEWLHDKNNRDIILPEEKCVVVMKPRRFAKHYSDNAYMNRLENQWNFHSFVMIRNGENIYAIESENLCVYDSVIPNSIEMEKLYKEIEIGHDFAEEQLKNINYRAVLFGMFIQGIADRTNVFQGKKISVMKSEGTQCILDDEKLLGTGLKDWPEFLKEINQNIGRGSRIVYAATYNHSGHFYRNYSEWSAPYAPNKGIYNLDYPEGNTTTLSFLYLPGDTVFNATEDRFTTRKNRVRWVPNESSLINFDALTYQQIEVYLHDRTQRKYYCEMIPLLQMLKKELEKEMHEEQMFTDLMIRDIKMSHFGKSVPDDVMEKDIKEAIEW